MKSILMLLLVAGADKPAAPRDPVTVITLAQRRSVQLPGSQLMVNLGDISAGQMLLHITYPTGRDLVSARVVRAGDVVPYEVSGRAQQLSVVRLVNLLVGEDYAVMVHSPRALTEPLKIEVLLQGLRGANLPLQRGGKETTAAEVERGWREQWKKSGDTVKTVEGFIDLVMPKSAPESERLTLLDATGKDAPLRELLLRQAASFFARPPASPRR